MTAWTLVDELGGAFFEALGFDGGRGIAALDVEAEELLGAADDAGLGDGGERAGDDAGGVDAGAVEDGGQLGLLGVVAPEAAEEGLAAEAGEVHGDVGCAACALVAAGVAEDGNRGFGRDALDVAVDVAVEHDVADDEDFELAEAALEQIQNGMKLRQHA